MLKDYLWTVALVLPFARCGAQASGMARPAGRHPHQPAALPPPILDIEAQPAPIELVACAEPPLLEPPAKPARSPAPRHAEGVRSAHPGSAPPARRAVNPHEAVMRFCGWMRDWGFVGWHPADDIVGFYQWFCDDEGLEEMNHDLLRERFACAPGVARERRRLNGTTDKEMVRIKRRLGGADRAMLYRVASHEELAERAKAGKRGPRSARPGKKAGKTESPASGRTPKTAVKTVSEAPVRRAA